MRCVALTRLYDFSSPTLFEAVQPGDEGEVLSESEHWGQRTLCVAFPTSRGEVIVWCADRCVKEL